ncbi:uncharacterized protein [Hyperolius riggenbachi]|uniref:uncharacterized protein n=1 Tax=Hyperolius riggenbachi TaxID=752182 RepID=UPI0035A2BBF3
MYPGALPPLRIAALLCLLLLLLTGLVTPVYSVEYSVGDAATLRCLERCETTIPRDSIIQITWWMYNNTHFLLFSTDTRNKTFSNFSDRFSFQDPLTLQIRDAQRRDAGNYTCHVTPSDAGTCTTFFIISLAPGNNATNTNSTLIYASSSAAGVVIIAVIIAGIIFHKTRSKPSKPPAQIHQTSPEANQRVEPIYDNANEDYCLRFNTLYDTIPGAATGDRPCAKGQRLQ